MSSESSTGAHVSYPVAQGVVDGVIGVVIGGTQVAPALHTIPPVTASIPVAFGVTTGATSFRLENPPDTLLTVSGVACGVVVCSSCGQVPRSVRYWLVVSRLTFNHSFTGATGALYDR